MNLTIRWQLDRPNTVIYWSFIIILILISPIMMLEKSEIHLGYLPILFFAFFLIFLNRQRKITISPEKIMVFYGRFWKKQQFSMSEIQRIHLEENKFLIKTEDKSFSYDLDTKNYSLLREYVMEQVPNKLIE